MVAAEIAQGATPSNAGHMKVLAMRCRHEEPALRPSFAELCQLIEERGRATEAARATETGSRAWSSHDAWEHGPGSGAPHGAAPSGRAAPWGRQS